MKVTSQQKIQRGEGVKVKIRGNIHNTEKHKRGGKGQGSMDVHNKAKYPRGGKG